MVTAVRRATGAAVAALLSIGIGGLMMALAVGLSDANKAFQDAYIWPLGAWVPGYRGIGPYSGKFTFFLVGWLLSWLVLHLWLRRKDMDMSVWSLVGFVLIGLAVLLVWPPITHMVFVR